MPSYPTSIYAPASKTNGQVITPAMFNDPEAEIIAVETGLKTGIQHAVTISTGGLTVSTGNTVLGQNLDVAGNSTIHGTAVVSSGLTVSTGATTIGGTLQVNGLSTFTGLVTFSGGFTGNITVPRVHLTSGADQNLAGQAWTGISWPAETYDSDGMHSTAVNSSRITFAHSTGVYHIGCTIDMTNASSGVQRVRIILGDSTATVVGANAFYGTVAPSVSTPIAVSCDARISDTTVYATVQVWNGHLSTNSVTSTGNFVTAFWAHKVSA